MAFSMSGVSDGYSYNRFDIYEKKSKDCDCKPKEDCDCDDKKSKGKGGARWQDSDGDGKWYEPGEDVAEGMMPLPKEKMARQADKAYGKEQQAVKAGDEAGVNKQMQRRIAMKDPAGRKNQLMNKEEDESYTAAYMEAYQKLPKNKMQDKAAMKPDTAKGEKQARKLDLVRKATEVAPDEVKGAVKGQEMRNKKRGLERRFNAPSADDAAEKDRKNKAYKLEGGRRKDLDNRYGPKKEELELTGLFSEEEISTILEALLGKN